MGSRAWRSALEKRLHRGLDITQRMVAAQHPPVDEESWRRVDAELFVGALAHRFNPFKEIAVVSEAGIEALLGKTFLLGDRQQRLDRVLHQPITLLAEQGFDERKISILAGAARQHESGRRQR